MDISIIVPAYNEEETIEEVIGKVKDLKFHDLEKEIIVVDDGSTDETNHLLKSLEKEEIIKLISYGVNKGKGFAIRRGFEEARGRILVTQDSDLEYDPVHLPHLIEVLMAGEDVVYGSRFLGDVRDMSLTFYLGNRLLSIFTSLLYGQRIHDMETGYKIISKEVSDRLDLESDGFEIEPELTTKILRCGYRIKEVPIGYKARSKKEKKITLLDGLKALWVLIKYRFWRPAT